MVVACVCGNGFPADEDDTAYQAALSGLGEGKLKTMRAEEVTLKAVYETGRSKTVITSENLVFRVAPDMPIEKYASYVGPIGLDSYVYFKFKEMQDEIDKRFTQLDWRLSELEKNLSEIKALVSGPQVLMRQAPPPEASPPAPRKDTSKLL